MVAILLHCNGCYTSTISVATCAAMLSIPPQTQARARVPQTLNAVPVLQCNTGIALHTFK